MQFWLSVESFKSAGQGAHHARDCMPPLDDVDTTGCGNILVSTGAPTLGKATCNSQSLSAPRNEMSTVYKTDYTRTPSEQPNAVVSNKDHFIISPSLGASTHPENDSFCINSNRHRSLQESGSMSGSEYHGHGTAYRVAPTGSNVGSQPSITPQSVEKRLSRHKSLSKKFLTFWGNFNMCIHGYCISTVALLVYTVHIGTRYICYIFVSFSHCERCPWHLHYLHCFECSQSSGHSR